MAKPRSPRTQDLVWRLEALGFNAFIGLLRLMPVDLASALGAGLVRLLGPLTGTHKTAERNIRLAFPGMPLEQRKKLLADQWGAVGRTFAEFGLMDRLTPASGRVEVVNAERLEEIRTSGQPVVFVSGHLSNWEIMPAVIVQSGVPCQVTYRAANNPYVDAAIRKSRARYGVKMFAPKGGEGFRAILDGLERGESTALMMDQKFNGGVSAPFFGRLVDTAPGPVRMALRSSGVLQTMSVQRTKGARFRVVVHEPIHLTRTGDRAADVEAGVRQVNAFIEACVRARPEEWFWVHKRWPDAAYAELAAMSPD